MPIAFFIALTVATTPRIEEFVSACDGSPVEGFTFTVPANAVASGEVKVASDGSVELAHCFLENHEVRSVRSIISGLETIDVKVGSRVTRGQRLGRAGKKAKVEIDGVSAKEFVTGREVLLVPKLEAVLVVVDVDGHQAERFEHGQLTHTWDVGQGQVEGVKEERGDLKTPRGFYFVVDRTTGPFAGDYAGYFGKAWVKLNYPNAFDAARGVDAGLITEAQQRDIASQWKRRALTAQKTKLGGGIGFHGWIEPWSGDAGYGLSWGCVVMHPEDVRGFYDVVPVGTPVVLR
ncbi:MAG: L,D-transpeptidase family protein [Archangium sp.]